MGVQKKVNNQRLFYSVKLIFIAKNLPVSWRLLIITFQMDQHISCERGIRQCRHEGVSEYSCPYRLETCGDIARDFQCSGYEQCGQRGRQSSPSGSRCHDKFPCFEVCCKHPTRQRLHAIEDLFSAESHWLTFP